MWLRLDLPGIERAGTPIERNRVKLSGTGHHERRNREAPGNLRC